MSNGILRIADREISYEEAKGMLFPELIPQKGNADVLAYPDFLQEASEKIGGNFFILPSSIHELLFLKDTGDITRQELTSMVRSVNAAEVSPAEQLSDNVYHYDGKDRVFELAEKYEARTARREMNCLSVLGTIGKAKEAQKDQPVKARTGKTQEAVI